MTLATWWYEDALPNLVHLPGLAFQTGLSAYPVAQSTGLPEAETRRRLEEGHRAFVALVHGTPAGFGWVASRRAFVGELGLDLALPKGNRYLWDFVTYPRWRGRGVYPQLLQHIITAESPPATRLWIIHAPENAPSAAGITRAGFRPVADLSFRHRMPVLRPLSETDRVRAAAELLRLPVVHDRLTPCWKCGAEDHHCAEDGRGRCACQIVRSSG